MSRKSIITIVVGLLILLVTLLASNSIFTSEKNAVIAGGGSPQTRVEQLQLAETIHTTFLFVAVLELMIAGVLACRWRRSDIPPRPNTDGREESHKETSPAFVRFSVFTGIVAFVTSYVASLLDVFVFDVSGGLGSNTLACPGIPAGLSGILGGIVWYRIRRKSEFAPIDWVPLVLVGIVAGMGPGACMKLLPQ